MIVVKLLWSVPSFVAFAMKRSFARLWSETTGTAILDDSPADHDFFKTMASIILVALMATMAMAKLPFYPKRRTK